jgi:WD40 repeat protein
MATNAAGELLVVSRGTSSVERFDVMSRTHLGTLISSGEGGLLDPRAILVLSDGHILVSTDEDAVLEFTGGGEFVQELISPDAFGLVWIRGMAERPSGAILITSSKNNAIHEFDRDTGDSLGRWDRGGLEEGYWGLGRPWSIRIGPDGDVYVSTFEANTAVQVYEESTGLFKRRYYILSQLIPGPTGFDFAPPADDDCDGNLVLDSCDIAEGTHTDANENGIPDVCECDADHTGDGVVGVDDLLYVTANWGSPFGADDLLTVIASWGGCGG